MAIVDKAAVHWSEQGMFSMLIQLGVIHAPKG
jgi:hypothetical protein